MHSYGYRGIVWGKIERSSSLGSTGKIRAFAFSKDLFPLKGLALNLMSALRMRF